MRSVFGVLAVLLLGACYVPSAPVKAKHTSVSHDANDEEDSEDSDSTSEDADTETPTKAPGPRPGIEAFPGSKIFMPAKTPAPGIVMLHGSEGGSEPFIRDFAGEIAKQGFVVVTLCWFGCPGKSDKINRIPLESVVEMGQWLKGSPDVAKGKVGLFGWSRGAELSLLLTSLIGTDPFQAVAVHAPSDTVVAGFDPATQNNPPDFGALNETNPQTGKAVPTPSWTWKGQPLFGEPNVDNDAPGPKIAVEKYPGPVYVSQGEKDEVWPVDRGRRVVATRNALSGLVTESHFFPGEGHVLQQPGNVATEHAEVASFFKRKLAP